MTRRRSRRRSRSVKCSAARGGGRPRGRAPPDGLAVAIKTIPRRRRGRRAARGRDDAAACARPRRLPVHPAVPRGVRRRGSRAARPRRGGGFGEAHLVLELCGGGDLHDAVTRRGGPLGEAEARAVMRQLLCAVGHMHRAKVIHRDIKLENVLLTSRATPLLPSSGVEVRLADLGLAATTRDLSARDAALRRAGSLRAAASRAADAARGRRGRAAPRGRARPQRARTAAGRARRHVRSTARPRRCGACTTRTPTCMPAAWSRTRCSRRATCRSTTATATRRARACARAAPRALVSTAPRRGARASARARASIDRARARVAPTPECVKAAARRVAPDPRAEALRESHARALRAAADDEPETPETPIAAPIARPDTTCPGRAPRRRRSSSRRCCGGGPRVAPLAHSAGARGRARCAGSRSPS